MFLDFLFRRKNTPALPVPSVAAQAPALESRAPGTQIRFHADLIGCCEADHRELLKIYGAIGQAFASGDLAATAARLGSFRNALQSHLLTEKIKLYIYLEHTLAAEPERHALMQGFRHEMDDIGKAVIGFLRKYREITVLPVLAETFDADLTGIGAVLVERIRREEETLYPLYQPVR